MNKIINIITAVFFIGSAVFMSSCNKTFDQPPGPADQPIVANSTIAQMKALHTVPGQMDEITDDIIISGIVTANDESGNLYKQIYVEDTSGAIMVMLNATGLYTNYPVGRRVYIYCKGLYISDYNNMMQLGIRQVVGGTPTMEAILSTDIPNHIKVGSINNPVTPTVVTLGQLQTNMQNPYIGRLIKLQGFEFVPGDTSITYSDTSVYRADQNDSIQDCAGARTIIRTSAYADFAGVKVPRGNGDLTAIYTVYRTTKQFIIRNPGDVNFYGPRCGELPPGAKMLLKEDFETQVVPGTAPYNPVSIAGWFNGPEVGTKYFDARTFGGNKYALLSAFGSNLPEVKTWLVTPGINMDTTVNEVLSFKTIQGFASTPADLKVLLSSNFSGTGNPWDAGVTWTDITSQVSLSPGTATGFPSAFTISGNINLSAYTGILHIAFRYEGADPAAGTKKTSTWEVDDVKVYGF